MSPTAIVFTNTLTGKKEALRSRVSGKIRIYSCGPTVYGYTHVGNARAALTVDLIVRVLRFAGYEVESARNITDIDDKIIRVARDSNRDWKSVAQEFESEFLQEMKQLGVVEPTHSPRATESIEAMVTIIEGLIQKGNAYVAATPFGNDVYFRVKSFSPYGKLSRRNTEEMLAGTRVAAGESKEELLDFALWKAAKPGEPSWESPWGSGRPGWHIECSAMIWKHFPEGVDIHTGGLDLVFPHHENEIAQSEAFCGCELAPQWIHNGMLTVEREKMSKSVGNIFSTREFLEQYGPEVLRLLCLLHHYRGPIDFSPETIAQAESILARLYSAKAAGAAVASSSTAAADLPTEFKDAHGLIEKALLDDFNSAKALGIVLKCARAAFREPSTKTWGAWMALLPMLEKTLGILSLEPQQALHEIRGRKQRRWKLSEEFIRDVEDLMKARQEARNSKNFSASDAIRDQLAAKNVQVMDGPDGASWTFNPR